METTVSAGRPNYKVRHRKSAQSGKIASLVLLHLLNAPLESVLVAVEMTLHIFRFGVNGATTSSYFGGLVPPLGFAFLKSALHAELCH